MSDQSHVFLTALTNAINCKGMLPHSVFSTHLKSPLVDYVLASLLVDSGALASVPLSVELLGWLFSTGELSHLLACRPLAHL
jgi:hypothetical protein